MAKKDIVKDMIKELGHITPEKKQGKQEDWSDYEWFVSDGEDGFFVCDTQWQAEVISCLYLLLGKQKLTKKRT